MRLVFFSGGKKTLAEQKAEQLERARQERIAAAAKLKALKEGTQPATAVGKDTPAKPGKEETDAKDTKVQLIPTV